MTQKVSLEEDYTYKGNRNKDHGNYVKEMMIQNQEPESSGKAKDLKERLFKYNSNEKDFEDSDDDSRTDEKNPFSFKKFITNPSTRPIVSVADDIGLENV